MCEVGSSVVVVSKSEGTKRNMRTFYREAALQRGKVEVEQKPDDGSSLKYVHLAH